MSRPIRIIGGGIAGLSLGIGLRRHGVEVQVVEAGAYPRHKVCGEFLAGVRPTLLAELGLTELLHDALPLVHTAWHDRTTCILRAELPEPALSISRYALDLRLSQRLKEVGGQLQLLTRIRPEANAPGDVWATGRRPASKATPPWMGLKVHLSGLPLGADLEMHFGRGGYVGLSRLPEGRINLASLFRVQPGIRDHGPALLLAYLAQIGLSALAERLRRADLDAESFQAVAGLDYHAAPPTDRICLGDHWALTPPFTGNGMTRALEQVRVALPALVAYAEGRAHWPATVCAIRQASEQAFGARLQMARRLHAMLIHPLGQSLLATAGHARVVPFRTLYRLLH